jgi:hypothetical protein
MNPSRRSKGRTDIAKLLQKRLEWNSRRQEKSSETPFSLSFAAKNEKPPKGRKLVFARRVGLDD